MNKLVIVFAPDSTLLNKLFDSKFNHKYQIALYSSFGKSQSINVYDPPAEFILDPFPDIAFVYDKQPVHVVTRAVLEQCLSGTDVVYVSYHKSTINNHGHKDSVREICKMSGKYILKNLFEIESHHNSGSVYNATEKLFRAETVGDYNDALKVFHNAFPKYIFSVALAFLDQLLIHLFQEQFIPLPKELMEYQGAYELFKQNSQRDYNSAFNEFRDSIIATYVQENVSKGA